MVYRSILVAFLCTFPAFAAAATPGVEASEQFSFTDLEGTTHDLWSLLGTPVVVNAGSHF